jgi:hypothetical protein
MKRSVSRVEHFLQIAQPTQTLAQNAQTISHCLNYDPVLLKTFKFTAKSDDFSRGVSPRNFDPILGLT